MRIVHVITRADVGGAQTYVLELAALQHARGHRVQILAGHLGAMADAAVERGIPVSEAPSLRRDRGGFANVHALREIRASLAKMAPDVVHAHSSKAGALARVAARRLRLPTVYTAHGWPFQRGAPAPQRVLSRLGETFCGHVWGEVICVSEPEASLALSTRVVPRDRVHVVANGIADTTERRPTAGRSGEDLHLVMVARFAPPKDHLGVIAALAHLPRDGWTCTFVGDGRLRAAAEVAAAAAGFDDQVVFAGERDDVPELLAAADVGLLWSAYEGMPLALMEAMRAGLACVANSLPGTEAMLGGGAGVLLSKRSEALAEALSNLLGDRARVEHLAAAARRRYEKQFTLARNADEVQLVYERAIERVSRR